MSIGRLSVAREQSAWRRTDDRGTTIGAAILGSTLFLAILAASEYRMTDAGTGLSWEVLVPFAVVLPVTALLAVAVSLLDRPSVGTRAAVRGAMAAGLYALMSASLFLTVANVRAAVAGISPADRLFGELLTSGLVLLLSFPAATAAGLVVGLVSTVTLGRLG